MAQSVYTTREEWLGALTAALRPMFAAQGFPIPDKVRVSCSWPSRGGTSQSRKCIGQAWSPKCSADGTHETFLSPVLGTAADVGHVLVHELVHHAVGTEAGHKGPFRKLATALGLEGKMTATVAGKELAERLHALCAPLGDYPHAALDPKAGRKVQGTRMLKVECKDCGCVVRMTRKWLDECGAPHCACGGAMHATDAEKD